MIGLTRRQADTLRFIVGFEEAKGYSPSIQEIADGIGSSSKSLLHSYFLKGLEERGYIRRLPNRARAIEVLSPISVPRDINGRPLYFVKPLEQRGHDTPPDYELRIVR